MADTLAGLLTQDQVGSDQAGGLAKVLALLSRGGAPGEVDPWTGAPVGAPMRGGPEVDAPLANVRGLGDLSRATGLPPWYEQSPMDVAMGFAPNAMAGMGAGAIRAYHGSPHNFDRFDMSKIGTGEGAQAYGHGLYFSEAPSVANTYQSKVSAVQGSHPTVDGRPIDWNNPLETAGFELMRHNGDRAAAADFFERTFSKGSNVPSILRSDVALPQVRPAGHMYEVDINADPAHLLDWDKPLSGQSENVRAALRPGYGAVTTRSVGENPNLGQMHDLLVNGESVGAFPASALEGKDLTQLAMTHDPRTGKALYEDMARRLSEPHPNFNTRNPYEAAAALNEAGIPGIRYLDQGSRGAGQGTSNYVMFDDKLIDIIRKYGLAGLITSGAATMGTDEGTGP